MRRRTAPGMGLTGDGAGTLRVAAACGIALAVLMVGAPVAGQRAESEPELNARLARQAGGLVAGFWDVRGVERAGVTASAWPLIEGFFQRGMDRHLALESTVGLFRREETEVTSGGLGGERETRRTAYVVPLLTGLRFYPTQPGSTVEPWVGGAVGLGLGIEETAGTGGTLLGGSGGTRVETGFGFRGTAGVEVALSRAFRVGAGGGYQWMRFGAPVGATDTYRGLRATAGLTYRFQY